MGFRNYDMNYLKVYKKIIIIIFASLIISIMRDLLLISWLILLIVCWSFIDDGGNVLEEDFKLWMS